jgi:hypothetical protein
MPRNKNAERTTLEQEMSDSEELAHKKIINCTNTAELRNLGRYLYKLKCKWEIELRNYG